MEDSKELGGLSVDEHGNLTETSGPKFDLGKTMAGVIQFWKRLEKPNISDLIDFIENSSSVWGLGNTLKLMDSLNESDLSTSGKSINGFQQALDELKNKFQESKMENKKGAGTRHSREKSTVESGKPDLSSPEAIIKYLEASGYKFNNGSMGLLEPIIKRAIIEQVKFVDDVELVIRLIKELRALGFTKSDEINFQESLVWLIFDEDRIGAIINKISEYCKFMDEQVDQNEWKTSNKNPIRLWREGIIKRYQTVESSERLIVKNELKRINFPIELLNR